jgi:DNA-binding PadR family transcriptional regulator
MHRHYQDGRRHPIAGLLHMIGRRGHRHGFGHSMGGFGRGFGGDDGMPGGRKLGADDLQLLLLALLAEKPSHGYELIKALEERSNGFYKPSPGMVYPALTYLEELGYATVEAEGSKKLYSIAEPGRQHLERNRSVAEAILAKLQEIGKRMEQVRRAYAGEAAAEDESEDFGSDEFRAARHELKRALHDRRRTGPDEIRRVAEILRRAAAEILKG